GEVGCAAGAGVTNHRRPPYAPALARLGGGLVLFGAPPADIGRYLDALRAQPGTRAAALGSDGALVTAESLRSAVAVLLHRPWDEAEAHAKAAGALIGAYPVG